MRNKENYWDLVISSDKKNLDSKFSEIWQYRDLLFLFVKRDIVSFYKQTLFGPIWLFIQPIFTTIVYSFIFGSLVGLSSDGLPKPLFYLTGITAWNYFADCLIKTSTTFRDNAGIFGKVYFPRLISPLSIIISSLFRFGIQMLLLFLLAIYYLFNGVSFNSNWAIFLFPYFVLLMALLGLGIGMIITALTTKYRDLAHLITFGVQLLMYGTTVLYPLSNLSGSLYWVVALNPITFIIEAVKYTLFGVGLFNFWAIIYSTLVSIILLVVGLIFFNKAEKTFIDTI